MLWLIHTSQNKVSTDQVLVFDWIVGLCQVNLSNRARLFGSGLMLTQD